MRGRFGRKAVTCAGQCFCKLRIVNARLDHCPAIAEIHIQHAIHSREHEHNTVFVWQASACQAGTRPARHDRYAVMIADFYHGCDLPGRLGKYDRLGRIAIEREGIAIVDRQFRRSKDHILVAELNTEIFD